MQPRTAMLGQASTAVRNQTSQVPVFELDSQPINPTPIDANILADARRRLRAVSRGGLTELPADVPLAAQSRSGRAEPSDLASPPIVPNRPPARTTTVNKSKPPPPVPRRPVTREVPLDRADVDRLLTLTAHHEYDRDGVPPVVPADLYLCASDDVRAELGKSLADGHFARRLAHLEKLPPDDKGRKWEPIRHQKQAKISIEMGIGLEVLPKVYEGLDIAQLAKLEQHAQELERRLAAQVPPVKRVEEDALRRALMGLNKPDATIAEVAVKESVFHPADLAVVRQSAIKRIVNLAKNLPAQLASAGPTDFSPTPDAKAKCNEFQQRTPLVAWAWPLPGLPLIELAKQLARDLASSDE